MSRDDIQKLLGGYATGTLTPGEQEALFAAALDDQELFDALAREQSLRDLLRDPSAKAHLLTALDEKPRAGWAAWWRPAAVGLTMAAVTVLGVVVIRQSPPTPPLTVAVAKPENVRAPAEPAAAPQAAAPELLRQKEKESAAPVKAKTIEKSEKKVAANERRAEADAVTVTSRNDPVPAPAAVAGAAAVAQPAAAPPPPPQPQAKAKEEVVSAQELLAARRTLAPARSRSSARMMFLSQGPTVEAMKSGYLADAAAGQQGQARQQSPAAPAQQQQQFGARESAQLSDSKMLSPPQQPGVRYTIVGTTIRLETNDYGYLYAMARGEAGVWRPVLSSAAQRLQQYVITTLRPDEKEIFVAFSRTVEFAKAGPVTPQPGDEPATNLVEKEGETTYVVNPLPGQEGRQVSFTIRLP